VGTLPASRISGTAAVLTGATFIGAISAPTVSGTTASFTATGTFNQVIATSVNATNFYATNFGTPETPATSVNSSTVNATTINVTTVNATNAKVTTTATAATDVVNKTYADTKVSSVSGTGAIAVTAGVTPEVSVAVASTSVAGVASFANDNFIVSGAGAVSISSVAGSAITGIVPLANGGTNASSAASALTSLGGASLTAANAFTVGGHTITNSADVVPLMLKANATQTTNLFEIQPNGSTTPIIRFGSDGKVRFGTNATQTGTWMGIANPDPSWVGLSIRGAASQSANLQEWQTSTGAILASISGGGSLTVDGNINGLNLRTNGGDTAGGSGILALLNATTVPTANPAAGGIVFVEAGELKYRGSGGGINTIAPAVSGGTILGDATIDGGSA